ncbi:phosphopantetheinyl transferase [Wenjunlia vitaminophila]|uniref:Phosphopantetheinyl transferase n=1 Tax=Wenjunlia vitaminophila TaxID=76728 RepID=A0A0T6LUI1_WENVI|nr:phosphopantetheinyl transferase [Wenjunlia vitaminophila]
MRVRGTAGPWDRVRHDLASLGWAVLHARIDDWLPHPAHTPSLKRLLGRDWERYLRMRNPRVRARFAATRSLLKHAAGVAVQAPPHTVELAYTAFGRPYLRGLDQVDVSLSHTGDFLLVGLTTRGRIGVDAEKIDRPLLRNGTERHICTPYELDMLERVPEARRNRSAVRLWTLKEAYSKAIGQGLRFRFSEFGFGEDGQPVRVQRPDGTPGTGSEWTFATFTPDQQYCASVAVHDTGFGAPADTAAATMLDSGLVDAVNELVARARSEQRAAA